MEFLIPFLHVEFQLKAEDTIQLPPYKGSALRGGFGLSFRKVVCALKKRECVDCLLKFKCAYSYIFETPPPADSRMKQKYPWAPHPFVIEPPLEEKRIYERGEDLHFGLLLIGRAQELLPYFVLAFQELGSMGLGKGNGKYSLTSVHSGGQGIYPMPDGNLLLPNGSFVPVDIEAANQITLRFSTPARVVYEEQLVDNPEFHVVIRSLLRRISALSYFHCGREVSVDFKGIIDRAMAVQATQRNTTWVDWERYSSRQDTRMKLGGFTGEIEFTGDLSEFMPYLRAGEIVHLGKATSFGLGKYEMFTGKMSEHT